MKNAVHGSRARILFAAAIAFCCLTETDAGGSRALRDWLRCQYEDRNVIGTRDGILLDRSSTGRRPQGAAGEHITVLRFNPTQCCCGAGGLMSVGDTGAEATGLEVRAGLAFHPSSCMERRIRCEEMWLWYVF